MLDLYGQLQRNYIRYVITISRFFQKLVPMDKLVCYLEHSVELKTHKEIFVGQQFMGVKVFNNFVSLNCVYI
jgi:hypothetical protein